MSRKNQSEKQKLGREFTKLKWERNTKVTSFNSRYHASNYQASLREPDKHEDWLDELDELEYLDSLDIPRSFIHSRAAIAEELAALTEGQTDPVYEYDDEMLDILMDLPYSDVVETFLVNPMEGSINNSNVCTETVLCCENPKEKLVGTAKPSTSYKEFHGKKVQNNHSLVR